MAAMVAASPAAAVVKPPKMVERREAANASAPPLPRSIDCRWSVSIMSASPLARATVAASSCWLCKM